MRTSVLNRAAMPKQPPVLLDARVDVEADTALVVLGQTPDMGKTSHVRVRKHVSLSLC